MRTPPFHIIVGSINQIYDRTHNSCERGEYAFMVLLEYSIIFSYLLSLTFSMVYGQDNKMVEFNWGTPSN